MDGVWGPLPTAEQVATARAVARQAREEAHRTALADALTADEAAGRLGITVPALTARIGRRELVTLDDGGQLRLPAWQFAEGCDPGLSEVIAAWPGSALSLTMFVLRASPDLGGRTPARELRRRGGVRRVLELISALTADAW